MYAVTLSLGAAKIEHILYSVEQFVTHQWLVTAGIDMTLVDDESGVVRIFEHGVQLGRRHRVFVGLALRRSRSQSLVGHCGLKSLDAEIAGGVEFPRSQHQRRALRIEDDSADRFALELLFDI
nr:hypothetical protein [Nocardia bovistercoris]